MAQYASKTQVSSAKSRDEIERTLQRYGATQFMYGWDEDAALVGFKMNNLLIRFSLPMPDRNERRFTHTQQGRKRVQNAAEKEFEQATRQRWRALALVIKAKLEAVESGITTFEQEFMPNIVLPNNQTVGTYLLPQIAEAYEQGTMPKLLPS